MAAVAGTSPGAVVTGRGPVGLSGPQRQFLEAFFRREALAKAFYLAGGTALAAFHLHHRLSEDLDLFTVDAAARPDLARDVVPAVEEIGARLGWRVAVESPGIRHVRIHVHVPGSPPRHLRRIDLARPDLPLTMSPETGPGGIRVAGLRDLALGKVVAASRRRELKDIVDLFALDSFPLLDLRAVIERADHLDSRFTPLELAARAAAVKQEEEQWDSFRREFLQWEIRFSDLVAFGRRLARMIDDYLGPPAPAAR